MTAELAGLPILFALSAFFSSSETALFSLRRHDRDWLRGDGGRAARAALELLARPRSLLVAVLFGNLLVNFLLMALSARVVLSFSQQGPAGVVAGFLVTTVAVVVIGEVLPKAIAVTASRRVALLAAVPLLAFRNATAWLTRPLERLVSSSLDLVERRLPPPASLSDQDLRRFVELHGAEGSIESQASEFLAGAMELGSRRAHEIMTPRVDLVAVDLSSDTSRDDLIEIVKERQFGKVLVHEGGGVDQITGYLRTRDVLRSTDGPLADLVRPLWFVPGTKSLESLLREMVERHQQIALVVDEYGGTHGLVTLEDLVEEITGDIAREDAAPLLRPSGQGRWVVQGRIPLREVEDLLGVPLPASSATTLSGFLAHELGRIPEVGDTVWQAGVSLRVSIVERRRAREVEISLPRPGQRAPQGEVGDDMTISGVVRAHRRLEAMADESASPSDPPAAAAAPGPPLRDPDLLPPADSSGDVA
ncbi:MAG: HlyC/CorC family transporter [Planctomycetes bacterium]|nr:HlyC/CorC family transporter [Planctomycetota bacterium]